VDTGALLYIDFTVNSSFYKHGFPEDGSFVTQKACTLRDALDSCGALGHDKRDNLLLDMFRDGANISLIK
jgi:hypothetical protein